jgi:hypothetical protein
MFVAAAVNNDSKGKRIFLAPSKIYLARFESPVH